MSGNIFTTPTPASRTSRYNNTNMDPPEPTNLFSLPDSSPATVRKTLEVHEEELQRRIQLVAKLGESLMRQQTELRERLREVGEENYDESDEEATIDPNLKAKLADLERSYNDVERESARAFLSVKPVAANISSSGAQSGVFSSTGSVSPNKVTGPTSSRRQRNQPSRIQDIEFAADIGQSLLVEVRRLQALLQEREEALKNVEMEKTRLLEDLGQVSAKVRALEEEDSQLKEINWNLEVVVQEVRSSESEAKDIIERLHNQVNILNREKNEVISKWDDFKLAQQKLAEENDDKLKHNEAELALLRRHLTTKETECETLSKKVEELKQEVDESYKTTQRLRLASENLARQHLEPEDAYDSKQVDDDSPEHTPAISPSKAAPRHSALESETLKSSLHHAHRMIANLKNTIHREKTEKSELRRMLQEARDEVEQARQGVVAPTNTAKQRKGKHDLSKKSSRPLVGLLGDSRKAKAEIIALSDGSENDEWIDDPNAHSPTLRAGSVRSRRPSKHSLRRPSPKPQHSFDSINTNSSFENSSSFETANDESEAFATANEAEHETDAHYQTGLETGRDEPTSADDLTETEGVLLNIRSRRSSTLSRRTVIAKPSYASVRKNSIITDTSEDDSDYQRFHDAAQESEGHYDTGSPVPRHQRFKMRVARGRGRLSHRVGSNGSLYQTATAQVPDSPIAPRSSGRSNTRLSAIGRTEPPAPAGSLFAELGGGSFMDTEPEDQAEEEEVPTEPTTPAKPPVEYAEKGVNTEVPYPEPPPMVVPKISITTGSDPVEELMTPKRSYNNTAGSPIREIMTPRALFADIATETGDELLTPKRSYNNTAGSPIREIMTPRAIFADISTETGDELMTPKRVMAEASTHTGNDLMTPKRTMAEAGTHTGNDLMTPKPIMADAGSAPLEELMTPRRVMVSSGTDILEELRTPKREMTSSGTQYFETPKPAVLFASTDVQTTPVRTSDGGTQLGSPIRVRETRNSGGSPIHTQETRDFFAGTLMASIDVQTSPVRTSDGATQVKTPLGSPIRTRETKDGSTQHIQTPKREMTSSNVQTTPLRTSDGATQISTPLGTPVRTSDGATQISTPLGTPIRTSDGATQISTPLGTPIRTSDGATQSTPVASPIPVVTSDGFTQYTPVASPAPVRTNDGATQSSPLPSPPRRKETTDGATQVTPSASPRRGLLPAFGFRSRSQSPAHSVVSTKEEIAAASSEKVELPQETLPGPVAEAQPVSEGNTPKKVSETIDEANRPLTPTPQKENAGFLGALFTTWKRRGSNASVEPAAALDAEKPSTEVAQEAQKPTVPPVLPAQEVINAGVQTEIGADFFENLAKAAAVPPKKTTSFAPLLDSNGNLVPQVIQPTRPSSAGVLHTRPSQDSLSLRPTTPTLIRPGSASSAVDRTGAPHPPMPTDHKETIQKHVGPEITSMGPPLFAASATKSSTNTLRPFTPVSQTTSNIPVIETPKPNGRQSALSRRSSVTSFASELDERFGTITDGVPNRPLADGGTEPKMIQAITQTMIGEYLWKYTRNAGRGSMSTNRHRRFFWVHPYTRTLYWSDRDPASAGRQELRAKSVSIEGVRVISDDNPMPPGLHRKSLVIITPGRSLKFTAPTSQRHETWFNALSYLLLRTNNEELEDGETLMAQDFNPGYRTGRNIAPSLSSYNSRTTRNSLSPSRNESSLSNSRPKGPGPYQGSINRLSNIFRPGSTLGFTSFRSSKQNVAQTPSLYDASDAHDSQEDLRLQMEREEMEAARMENVRACCDGKHDVGTLNKKGSTPRRSNQLLGHTHSHHHHHSHDQPTSAAPSPSPSPAPAQN